MIEIYLFINPIGSVCYEAEKQILELMSQENKKIQLRIVPLMNLKTIDDIMKRKNISACNIEYRNQLTKDIYEASLDFKAAQLQGKKRGREFLLKLQHAVSVEGRTYTRELSKELFSQMTGDLEMFLEDRESDFVKEAFVSDQQVAREMGIKKHPSAVVYNYACDRDYGVLVEDCQMMEQIVELIQTTEEPAICHYETKKAGNGAHLFLV